MRCGTCGAVVCRGTVTGGDGESGYDVDSWTEAGIRAFGIRAMGEETYAPGERVYFFLFEDGDGMIIAKMR